MFWKKWFSDTKNEYRPPAQTQEIELGDTISSSQRNTEEIPLNDLRAVVVTDVGRVRTNNEDAGRFVRPSKIDVRMTKGFLAIVADGMGGHAAGEVASLMAVETIAKSYYQQENTPEESLLSAFAKANKAIWQAATRNIMQKGMGTTCTAVAICQNQMYVGHVGDSRLYLYKNTQLTQLSTDHTYVQELISQGVIKQDEAEKHPDRNVLTRAMGTHNKVEVDVFKVNVLFENNDRLLLCSDGLYDYFSQDELAAFFTIPLLNDAAQQMVDAAKQRGGHDNITVLLVEKVGNDEFQASRPTENVDVE